MTKNRQMWEQHLEASQRIARLGSWEIDLTLPDDTPGAWFTSDETYRILQVDKDECELNSTLFYARVHPDDVGSLKEKLYSTLKERSQFEAQHRIVWPDGTERVVYERAEIEYDETSGRGIKMIGTLQDITERVMAENRLKEANKELSMLFANMQEVYYSVDLTKQRHIQVSDACEKVYGYTAEDFLNNNNLWIDVVLPEDKHILYDNFPAMALGKPFSQAYRIRHKNGEIRWLESRLSPTLNADGLLVRLDGVTTDITESKNAEQVLMKSESKFRSLIQNSSDAITVIDANEKMIFASDSLYRITGFTEEETMGTDSIIFMHPDDRPGAVKIKEYILTHPGVTREYTYRRLKKDGTYLWAEILITNMIDDPAVAGIVINFRDITEWKNQQDELRALNIELKKSNKQLDSFVYSISHDLRSPITSMLGILNLAEMDTNDAELLCKLSMLRDCNTRLDHFIQDIFTFFRNARTEVTLERVALDEMLNEVVGDLRTVYAADLENKKLRIETNVRGADKLHSDKGRIRVVLNKLIAKAIRYADHKKTDPCIEVTISVNEKGAEILIKDNGIGIAEEHHLKVFEMFSRVSKKSIGSGLGLYIVKETIMKLKGSIELRSGLGNGAEFHIFLPQM
ncbi:MAG: PAS domain-containing protein [Taibaiella sp.]|nr:PAS domain-containing protein [Taibaiella sp.]